MNEVVASRRSPTSYVDAIKIDPVFNDIKMHIQKHPQYEKVRYYPLFMILNAYEKKSSQDIKTNLYSLNFQTLGADLKILRDYPNFEKHCERLNVVLDPQTILVARVHYFVVEIGDLAKARWALNDTPEEYKKFIGALLFTDPEFVSCCRNFNLSAVTDHLKWTEN